MNTLVKTRLVIGNWKSYKTSSEVKEWFGAFSSLFQQVGGQLEGVTVIVCPPFPYLALAKSLIETYKLPMFLASQNVSPFAEGAYTGEVSARMIAEFASYVLIGHSERRIKFREDDEMLKEKVRTVLEEKMVPIYCVDSEYGLIPEGVTIAAYEPVWAIGSGTAAKPEEVDRIAGAILSKNPSVSSVVYGGSVTKDNIALFLTRPNISGVLPGSASLTPQSFWEIILHAARL